MKSFASNRFSEGELRALRLAEIYVAKIGEAPFLIRCHELAHAMQRIFISLGIQFETVDGMYGPIEHTWLVTTRGNILDTYVPGREPQVQLIDMSVPHAAPGFARWESAAFGRPHRSWCYEPFPPSRSWRTSPEQIDWLYIRMNAA